MKDYHYSAEVKVGQTRYTYDIVREVNDTLPLVAGGGRRRTLCRQLYPVAREPRSEKKSSIKPLPKTTSETIWKKGFISHAILEGMASDKVDGNNLRFAASVSYPASESHPVVHYHLRPTAVTK